MKCLNIGLTVQAVSINRTKAGSAKSFVTQMVKKSLVSSETCATCEQIICYLIQTHSDINSVRFRGQCF